MQAANTHGDAVLRELAEGTLRRVAHAARATHAEVAVDAAAYELMRRTCMIAHARGLRAEQLLLVLKSMWQELPEAQRVPRHEAGHVLARVITACIREYYAKPVARPIDCGGDVAEWSGPLAGQSLPLGLPPTGGLQSHG